MEPKLEPSLTSAADDFAFPKESFRTSPEKPETIEIEEIQNLRQRTIERLHAPENKELGDLLEDLDRAQYLFDIMATMSIAEALIVLNTAIEYHADDYNFSSITRDKITMLVQGEEVYGLGHEAYLIDTLLEATTMKYHSPYPEVRAICDPTDNPDLPCETFRAYFLGILWVAIGAFINELFSFRQPNLKLRSTTLQILLYPCGKLLQRLIPNWGLKLRGQRYSLNQGEWNMKEQMLTTLMVNVGSGASNFMGYVLTMQLKRFFNQNWVSFGFIFLLNFSTQFFGFGLAGLLRRWVVYPSKAMWPSLLPTLMLNRTLLLPESSRQTHGWKISKYRFFFVIMAAMFVYFLLPGYAFTALSTFNWITWIQPNNKTLAIVTGSTLGLGFNPWTSFDWAVINYSNPLAVPFFSTANRYAGMLVAGLIMIWLYWKNYNWSGYIPINSNTTYNNRGQAYNASAIINDDLTLNIDKYKAYSPPFISLGYQMFYGSEFALFTFTAVYIVLSEHRQISESFKGFVDSIKNRNRSNYEQFDDPISRQMAKYSEVPDWWYACILSVSLLFGILACELWPTNTPSWAVLVIIAVCIALLIPSAILMSVTGYQLGFNDIGIILAGFMVKGHAIANMICRVYGWNVDEQAESFIGDQKLGHYSKIPPRAMFRCQLVATLVQVFVTIGALQVLRRSIPDLCSTTQADRFVCTFPHSLYTATLVWGVVGPERTFNSLYPILKWCFLIGALSAPIAFYGRKRFFKQLQNFNPILFLSGFTRFESAYNLSYYTPGLQISFMFMYIIRRRYLAWWTKYNYVLTAALSAGVAFSAIFIFVAFYVSNTSLEWWGNRIASSGVDGARAATLYTLEPGEFFGPLEWD
ncbi:OPT oligopeptide transporter protein-domain-containing protein [Lipomyces arxii]|uniref:OPT oligopeptide transporter protein-domain-containing protein n=1 Tax=Lipomyces arxii TaxID=56418 RepID=UPI0034CED1BB